MFYWSINLRPTASPSRQHKCPWNEKKKTNLFAFTFNLRSCFSIWILEPGWSGSVQYSISLLDLLAYLHAILRHVRFTLHGFGSKACLIFLYWNAEANDQQRMWFKALAYFPVLKCQSKWPTTYASKLFVNYNIPAGHAHSGNAELRQSLLKQFNPAISQLQFCSASRIHSDYIKSSWPTLQLSYLCCSEPFKGHLCWRDGEAVGLRFMDQ